MEMIHSENLIYEYDKRDEEGNIVGTNRAIDGVDIDVPQGSFVAVLGHNGSGKSTLAKHMNAILVPSGGTMWVDGRDTKDPAELWNVRQTAGMVFQNPDNQIIGTVVEEDVGFGPENLGVPTDEIWQRVEESLKAVGMLERRKDSPNRLSGGQKQRVAIARAMATNPKVLLCDEATSALDPTTTRSILKLIQDINRRLGITAIIITHEMAVVESICTHVAILEKGRMVETGTVEEVFSNPKTEAGRRLVFPEGANIDKFPVAGVVRVVFNGGSSYEPLIASLAIDCGVKVNILGADTRNVNGKAFGSMLLGLPEDKNDAAKAMNYLKAQPNVTVEEVPDYHE